MDNHKYMEIFVEESKEHIQILNDNILRLEGDPQSLEAINEIFRAAHTLKGMAGTLGFKAITEITHNMENVFDEIRGQKREVTGNLIDLLLECTDVLEGLVQDVIDMGKEGERDIGAILSNLKGPLTPIGIGSGQSPTNKVIQLDQYQASIIKIGFEQGLTPYWIYIKLQPTCLLKAARAYLVFQTLEDLGEIIKSWPEVQDIEEEKFEDTFGILLLTKHHEEVIKASLKSISELHSIDIKRLEPEFEGDEGKNEKKPRQSEHKGQRTYGGTNLQTRSIRVDTERLDHLMNLVSQLITIKNTMEDMVGYDRQPGMVESMEYLARVTNELHDAVMQVRMVPIEMVFSRFPRVVRDLAKNTQKQVKLNILGSDTEIDRTIIDEIGDPLIHLLRNAIDHGIETPEERRRIGKDPEGGVDLVAYHDGNNVVVEIKDDGRGIDLENIAMNALEKSLISKEEMESLGEKEIIDLMFLPGFSTAQSVSNISGRGVGMDVVKTKVESLGGVIDVDTQIGLGSRFIIRLPLTLSIIHALLVEISHEIFAIPLSSIQEIIDVPNSEVNRLREQEVITYREGLIPLIRLEEELDIEPGKEQGQDFTAVVIKKGEKLTALSVGKLIGQQEVVIKPLGKYLSNIKVISGATILGNGQVALILDINRLV